MCVVDGNDLADRSAPRFQQFAAKSFLLCRLRNSTCEAIRLRRRTVPSFMVRWVMERISQVNTGLRYGDAVHPVRSSV